MTIAGSLGGIDDPATKVVEITDNSGRSMSYSRNDLLQMRQTRFRTAAPFMQPASLMEGPSVAELLDVFAPGESFRRIEIAALDSYVATADVTKLVADGAIIAVKRDGALLPIADKGPACLIFPFDDRPALKDKRHYGLCIWQIVEIRLS
ncbi:hypothetical protein [Jiella mangrovi]|uniref:Oxidoreductase molybdopterin-binding domain-containing protein n=1 Tax=Jiella mangrovi TaxID=2821407 RepID=A0ABS4BBX6_9HYPH|nr:hypothetical protein [Jiella mangrovi]MBP0614261.1 hypothetical protein [Jiella mangrovi]